MLEIARRLESSEDEEEIRQNIQTLLERIEEEAQAPCTEDVQSIYEMMRQKQCLARVERLSRVLETIETGAPLHISDKDETHFANAVVPVSEGLKIAFAEGQAPGPVRLVVGFGKTIIGFKTDNLSVEEIEFEGDDMANLRDNSERKFLCRHVVGDLRKEDILSIVMRIPRHLMPEGSLTPKEIERKLPFITRGFKLPAAE